MPLAHRQRLESETPIERIRLRIQWLRQQRADAGVFGNGDGQLAPITWRAFLDLTAATQLHYKAP